jgi:hypothetical protein
MGQSAGTTFYGESILEVTGNQILKDRSDDYDNKSDQQGSGMRGGTSKQHAQAGRQSHKSS